ncbi:MAG: DUF2975 domain-containing protein [Clostridia bacterium]|nr:DUF2975 domain-containing protein [Clostridia bacterium]
MYKTKISQIAAILVNIMFFGGILACILTPWGTKFYSFRGREYIIQTGAIFLSGVASVYIMYELRRIFKTITNNDPFVMDNAASLKKISIASFAIAAVYIVKAFLFFTPATFVIIVIFITAGLFCLTLMTVFTAAVRFKEENSLTI